MFETGAGHDLVAKLQTIGSTIRIQKGAQDTGELCKRTIFAVLLKHTRLTQLAKSALLKLLQSGSLALIAAGVAEKKDAKIPSKVSTQSDKAAVAACLFHSWRRCGRKRTRSNSTSATCGDRARSASFPFPVVHVEF